LIEIKEEVDMSIGEIIFMVAVVGVAVLMAILKDKVPAWLGFVLMLVASAVAIVGGAVTSEFKAIPLGVAGVIGTIIAWVTGAKSSASADDDTLGGIASNIGFVPWLIIAAVVAGAAAVTFAIPEAPAKSSQPGSHRRAQIPRAGYGGRFQQRAVAADSAGYTVHKPRTIDLMKTAS
jgi:hypothetical protein